MELGRAAAKRLADGLFAACCVVAAVAMALVLYVSSWSGLSVAGIAVALFAGTVIVAFGKLTGLLLTRLAGTDPR